MRENIFQVIVFGDENLHSTQQPDHTATAEMLEDIFCKHGMYLRKISIVNGFESIRVLVAEHIEFLPPFSSDRSVTL